jgi:hydrogenase maturation protein HypF
MRPMIEAVVGDVLAGKPASFISACFHNTIAALVCEVCVRIGRQEQLNRVCLSGGTFQNMFLLQRAVTGLRKLGFEVFQHALVPPNDGGISLGQAVIANEILRER